MVIFNRPSREGNQYNTRDTLRNAISIDDNLDERPTVSTIAFRVSLSLVVYATKTVAEETFAILWEIQARAVGSLATKAAFLLSSLLWKRVGN